jgi:hypothetical protein
VQTQLNEGQKKVFRRRRQLPFFGCAADFIDEAISNRGKCMVNCQMGVSRSASCAMAYLMIKRDMTAVEVSITLAFLCHGRSGILACNRLECLPLSVTSTLD